MADNRQEFRRRLQVGVVGLSAVLLMVSLVGLVNARSEGDTAINASDAANGLDMAASNEPLAELGIQPPINGETVTDEVLAVPTAQPQPAASKPVVPDLQPDPELEKARRQAQ